MWSGAGIDIDSCSILTRMELEMKSELISVTNSIVPFMHLSHVTSPQLPLVTVIQLVRVSLVKQAGLE